MPVEPDRLYYNEEQVAAAQLRVALDDKQGKKSPWFLIQIAEKGYIDHREATTKSEEV
jgi:hypothetical protein